MRSFLGICLGLQLLFTESEEFGPHPGIDLIKGAVRRLPDSTGLKIPHMGWNQIRIKQKSPLLEGVDDGSSFYFVHSYYVAPEEDSAVCTETEYGHAFTSSIIKDNLFACQFHPEKSQSIGLRLLANFARWNP